jgi:fatty-acid peroxygenase
VVADWRVGEQRTIFPLAVDTIARTVLPWAGIDADDQEIVRRGRQLGAVVDGFSRPLRPYLRAAADRMRLDRWAADLIREVRAGRRDARTGTALRAAADHRDTEGAPLPARIAGVELLNVVRPTIAAAWFVTFAAMALQHDRQVARQVADRPDLRYAFAQEVRRFYPFVPALTARTRHAQEVLGHRVRRNAFVVLDVYGTNHDPNAWGDPDEFRPDRFLHEAFDPDAFVPQGGGDVRTGHRCPGEDVVSIMITAAVRVLAGLDTELPAQNLAWRVTPLPTLPDSGVTLVRS